MNELVIPKRLEQIQRVSLSSGSHRSFEEGVCVMEAVAYIAGESWADHPECACPVITAFLISWNDSLRSNDERTRLLSPLVPLVVGTRRTKEIETRRSYMALDWLIRVFTPKWFDTVPTLHEHSKALRELDAIADMAGAVAAGVKVRAARDAAWAATGNTAWAATGDAAGNTARDAAWAAAWAAAGDAAWAATGDAAWAAAGDAAWAATGDAAWAAAWAAAGDAAWDAARDAAWAAAGAAAGDAAWDAARDAAWAAAGDAAGAATGAATGAALKPTTAWLQASAVDLVHRMIVVRTA